MASSAAAVGEALRRAREQKGLTQAQVAKLVGKTQAAISFWESGRRSPHLNDLVELVAHLNLDLEDVVASAGTRRQPTRALLRAQAERVVSSDVTAAIDRLIEEAEAAERSAPELTVASDRPIAAAQELLAKAAVKRPPVPVDRIAERCGVRLHELAPGEDGISGLLLELETGAVIGFATETRARQRFTIAHELGHHLLRHYRQFHIDPERTASDGHPPGYDWRDEREANDFAAELLMPASWVAHQFRLNGDAADLATRFGVSKQAMGYRLVNLGLR